MRLTAIKLAGFKSFVDPTTFRAPTNLTGIVGPNGCGKSNIIDAVRWVMGEGSARVLRGEMMSDVIFSGSAARKPVGTATVELLFDNSDGQVAGEFAGYNEISVKRQVGRDGVSAYFLNGTRCRRKDITDLFLGTGLGPRSYSIIEQGMISQVVEAKPEDLRGHLEEAAGISRYKERRRETERRISHTRDNLDRLADLREEVGNHLARLKRQAKQAERYTKLKAERRDLEARLLALQWKELRGAAEQGRSGLSIQQTALEENVAAQREAESNIEKLHEAQASASEDFNEVQGALYEVGGEIARLEQTIAHARELQARQKQEYTETEAALRDLEQHIILDRAQVEDLTQRLAESEPALREAETAETRADEQLAAAEAAVQQWQERRERYHAEAGELNRRADAGRAGVELLDQRIAQATERLRALEAEREGMDSGPAQSELDALENKVGERAGNEETLRAQLETARTEWQAARARLREDNESLGELRREAAAREGRLASLQALQKAAREASGGRDWLEAEGLADADALASLLDVSPGWEAAVETVLGHWLDGVAVEAPAGRVGGLAGLEDAALALLDPARGEAEPRKGSLAEKVRAPDAVSAWLDAVRPVASVDEALARLDSLAPGESVVTRAGEWMGRGWVRVARGGGSQAGMLAREREIQELQARTARDQERIEALEAAIAAAREALPAAEEAIADLQGKVNAAHGERVRLESERAALRRRMEELGERERRMREEAEALEGRVAADREELSRKRRDLEGALEGMAGAQSEREELDRQRGDLITERDSARLAAREARDRRHELALSTGSLRASLESLRQSLGRMDTQLNQLQERYVTLSEQVATAEAPEKVHREAMDGLLARRAETETKLAAARARLQELEAQYREEDAARQTAIQHADEVRASLEQARLRQQEIELGARSLERQVEKGGQDIEAVAAELPEDADTTDWEASIERISASIARLEPVNLAAISEYDEELKRKEYLDAQNEDLTEALATLESAIAKIDRKTRTRFKETFERVNKGVQELFPRLFGGGHAYLELTGEDLLTTGVSIMARPPGKRVSSIHLLSGGEKALTAVSFVFSIFRLNPAPFCLLDEVDAPLDDANVGRFSALVREMSETVQFIIVTHNKITMEMAHQLSGVTMREPGVSRLVQVDIEEAAKLAEE